MKDKDIHKLVKILRKEVKKFNPLFVEEHIDPFKLLISCILSSRTKDEVTKDVSKRLFLRIKNPQDLLKLSLEELKRLIYPVGFYRKKAKLLKKLGFKLINEFEGKVPKEFNELLKLPGVGRKTANLVVTRGFLKPGICVDTHVHRIINRLGYVNTKTPEQTEKALRNKLPKQYWIEFNELLVKWGQNVCKPVIPNCSECALYPFCERKGIKKS